MHLCHLVPVNLLLSILVCHSPFYWVTIKLLPEGPNVLLLGICRGNQLLHMIKRDNQTQWSTLFRRVQCVDPTTLYDVVHFRG